MGGSHWVRYANFVRLPHTVFVLPFALVGVVLASYTAPVTWGTVGWVVVAFTAARFAAMGFNRIVDREFDAANPRTAMRELPRGEMTVVQARWAVAVAVVLFLFAAWKLNGLCFSLSPLALGWILFYSYTKRFTSLSHIVLGLGMGIAPVGGYVAVTGAWSDPWWLLVALAGAVMAWGAGFDVLYALQDEEFDKAHRLHSIPVAVGARRAIVVSRALHGLAVVLLGAVAVGTGVGGTLLAAGVVVVALLLAYEHSLVSATDQSKLNAAFFTMNGVISIVFFGFVLADRLVS